MNMKATLTLRLDFRFMKPSPVCKDHSIIPVIIMVLSVEGDDELLRHEVTLSMWYVLASA